MENKRKAIINRIIKKGGFIGASAKLCVNNEQKEHRFILECSEQFHTELAEEIWGEELMEDIRNFISLNNKN